MLMFLVFDLVLLAGPFQDISAKSEGDNVGWGCVGVSVLLVVLCVMGGVLGGITTGVFVELAVVVEGFVFTSVSGNGPQKSKCRRWWEYPKDGA